MTFTNPRHLCAKDVPSTATRKRERSYQSSSWAILRSLSCCNYIWNTCAPAQCHEDLERSVWQSTKTVLNSLTNATSSVIWTSCLSIMGFSVLFCSCLSNMRFLLDLEGKEAAHLMFIYWLNPLTNQLHQLTVQSCQTVKTFETVTRLTWVTNWLNHMIMLMFGGLQTFHGQQQQHYKLAITTTLFGPLQTVCKQLLHSATMARVEVEMNTADHCEFKGCCIYGCEPCCDVN